MPEDEQLSIPWSVALRMFNELMGTDCKTMDETVQYLRDHPEEHAQMEDRINQQWRERHGNGS